MRKMHMINSLVLKIVTVSVVLLIALPAFGYEADRFLFWQVNKTPVYGPTQIVAVEVLDQTSFEIVIPDTVNAYGPAILEVDLLDQTSLEIDIPDTISVYEPENLEVKGTENSTVEWDVLTLDDAINIALSNNRTLEMARQSVDLARAGGRSSMAQFLPDLSFNYSWTHALDAYTVEIGEGEEFEITPQDTFRAGLTFTYNLYNGGADRATERAAWAGTEAAEFRVRQSEALIRLFVTTAYTGVLEAEAGLEASRMSLVYLDEVLHTAQANYDAGFLPLSDLLAAQVARSQTELGIANLGRSLEIARSGLSVVLGGDITGRWTLSPVDFPEARIPFTIETLMTWALESRPELRELDAELEAIDAQIDAIKSARNPRISFQADITRTGTDPLADDGGGFSEGTNIQGMIGIWWDLWDFGRTSELASPLEEQLELLYIQRADIEVQIQQEIGSTLLNIQSQFETLQVTREAIAQAEEAFRVAQRRQEEGLGRMLEVLNAEATLAQLQAGYTGTLYAYYRGIATLAQTVGMSTDDLVALILASMEEQ